MAVDPSVIAALEAAVAQAPENDALRVHLAGLLLEAGRPEDALTHTAIVIGRNPTDPDALRIAASAADASGRPDQAAGYRRIASALGGGEPTTSAPSRVTPDGSELIPETADELLEKWGGTEPAPEPEIGAMSRPGITLADVGGMEGVKRRLELSFLAPLRNPELRAQFGKSLHGGLLLWGPPGCGKTYLARALAGELGASFYEIGLSDILDMWIGSSERNLSAVFDWARRNQPCLLFFDEIDALGQKRSQLRAGGAAMRGVVNQFLAELDGAGTDNEGLFMLAATNHPWDVDSALLRPGRFDRSILVLPPDHDARRAILALHLRSRPTSDLDLDRIAKMTDGRSGADLALICDHATERAMEASLNSGTVRAITQDDLLDAVRATSSSIGPWLDTARNYAQFGNTTGAYDELAEYLRRKKR